MKRSWNGAKGWLLAVAVLLVVPASASAATGQLTTQGCIDDTGGTACAAENQGLGGAHAVAMSPDGRSVYATSLNDDAVSIFTRNTTTGALTPAGCISDADNFPGSGCAVFAEGMADPFGVAVSPDGLDVYVTGTFDDSVAHLERDPVTGELSEVGCIGNTLDIAGCGGATQFGLADAKGVVVDPDGSAVYVSAGGSGNLGAVVRLTRNTMTGEISPGACVADPDLVGCATTQEGLSTAYDIVISADGESLHVAGRDDSAIVSLSAPGLGSLGCFSDPDNPLVGCPTVQGLSGVRGVAVSPDGKSVYTVSGEGALVRFGRVPTGVLTPAGCISDTEVSIGCASTAQGLGGGGGIAVSPDNKSVYSVGDDDAIVRFDRNATNGVLSAQGCIGEPAACGATPAGLNTARRVVVSPNGKSVYSTSFGHSAIARFDRETATVAPPPPPPPPPPPSNEVTVRTKRVKCKGACKRIKVKVDVDGPGKARFCNAPADSVAPCGIGGKGPSGPTRAAARGADRASSAKLIKSKSVEVAEAGTVTVALRLTKKARKRLVKKGRLSVKLQVDFTPTGGTLGSDRQRLKVKRTG